MSRNDAFDVQLEEIRKQYTPFIGIDYQNDTVQPYMLLGFTFDQVKRECRLPVIDQNASPIITQTKTQITSNSYRFDSVESYLDEMNSVTTDEYPYVNGMFSHNQDITNFYKTYFSGDSQLVVSQSEYSYWIKTVDPGSIVFNSEFNTIVNEILPAEYDNTLYMKFIEEFGTHIAFAANFGGLIESQIFLKDCSVNSLGGDVITNESEQDTQWYIEHSNENRTSGNTQYIEHREIHSEDISGGNPMIECSKTCDDRIATFQKNPVVTSFTYVSTPYLINNMTISNNLNKAIGNYVEQARQQRLKDLAYVKQQNLNKRNAPKVVTVTLQSDLGLQMRYSVAQYQNQSLKIERGNVNLQFYISRSDYQIQLKVIDAAGWEYGSWGGEDSPSVIPGVVWKSGKFVYDSDVLAFYDCEQVIKDSKGNFVCACPVF